MDIRFTPEQERWRGEVRAFLEAEMTPEFVAELESQDYTTSTISVPFSRKLAQRGWLTLYWPREYGGQERSFIDYAILEEELGYFRAPTAAHNFGVKMVGVALLHFGTEEQRRRFLPPISRQEVVYCQAFTEPNAGSDSANVETRAIPQGDDYIIDGQKTLCTSAHRADTMYLSARTDPTAPKHRGISMFLVDVNSPGVTIVPWRTVDHGRVNHVFLDGVRVPASRMVGEKNRGFQVMMASLNLERTGVDKPAANRRTWEELVAYARETRRNGRPLAREPLVRYRLAECAIEIEVQRMLAWRVADMRARGLLPTYEASVQSLRVREFEHRFANFAMELLGLYGQLRKGSKWAPLLGRVEKMYLNSCSQHAGGTTEIQKNVIALRGLNMPR